MLVLSRRTGESVVIGDDVVVTVLEIKGDGGVRLGIDAPRSTRVHRAEVYAAVRAANADASRAAAEPTGAAVAQLLSLAAGRAAGARPSPDGPAPDGPASDGPASDGPASGATAATPPRPGPRRPARTPDEDASPGH